MLSHMSDGVNFTIRTPLRNELGQFLIWLLTIAGVSWVWTYPRVLYVLSGEFDLGVFMDLLILAALTALLIFFAFRNLFSREVITVSETTLRIRSGAFAQDVWYHWSQVVGFEAKDTGRVFGRKVLRINLSNSSDNIRLCAKEKPVMSVREISERELPESASQIAERLRAYQEEYVCSTAAVEKQQQAFQ